MCGIAGIRRFDGRPVDPSLLRRMAAQMIHRGPDDEGFWHEGPVGFAHTRLSIIDVAASRQPMTSPDGRRHLTFNGEILNYRQLRASHSGRTFATSGDTEVLLAELEKYGSSAVEHLLGQFAFATFEATTGELLLARDRMGILPLFWYADDHLFAFASEVKALLPAVPGGAQVDEMSVADLLADKSVHAPFTLFKGIRKLRAGERLIVDARGRIEAERYWSLPDASARRNDLSDAAAIDEVDAALQAAIDTALTADVPVGSLLSGGLDSSLIAALAKRRNHGAELHTFAAGFEDATLDELATAREAQAAIGSIHHEVKVTAEAFAEWWPKLIYNRDAPLSETADVAVHLLAADASNHVKVLLSGEGADELFGGYPKYATARMFAAALAVPAGLRGPVARTLDQRLLPDSARRLRVAARTMGAPDFEAWMHSWFAPFTDRDRERLLGADVVRQAHDRRTGDLPVAFDRKGDVVDQMLRWDCGGWLADNLLERGDRMTMAASVELRPPLLLDHRIVELAFTLPTSVKVRSGTGKWVLRRVAERYLPDPVVERKKAGFPVPIDSWFRGPLRTLTHDVLTDRDAFVTSLLDRRTVLDLLAAHDAGRDEAIRLFILVGLELWHRQFVSASRAPLVV